MTKIDRTGAKGGLSDAVFNHAEMRDYLAKGLLIGYIGEAARSVARDREVEQALRREGMDAAEIATLLTWKQGGHLAEDLANGNLTGERLEEVVRVCLRGIDGCLEDVRRWAKLKKAEHRTSGEKCLTPETAETAAERSSQLAAKGEEQSAGLWEWHSTVLQEERDDRLAVRQSEEAARELASYDPSDKGDPR